MGFFKINGKGPLSGVIIKHHYYIGGAAHEPAFFMRDWGRESTDEVFNSQAVEDMDLPGYRLHPLKGRMKNRWSIWVSGNWRLTFEFQDGNAHAVDYEDYHK